MSPESEPAPLEPSVTWQVVVTNCLVMLFALGVLPVLAASLLDWDPMVRVAGVFFGVPTALLGVSAYRSLVRQRQRAADFVSVGSFAVAGMAPAPAIGLLLQGHGLHQFGYCLLLLGLSATAVWCGIVNREWAAQLQGPKQPYDPVANYHARKAGWRWHWEAPSLKWRDTLLTAVALVWVLGAARWHALSLKPQSAEHVAREEAPIELPPDATDVSYRQSSHSKYVEFTCSEATFLEWLEWHKSWQGTLTHEHSTWNYFAMHGGDNILRIGYDAETKRAYFSSDAH